jgi:aminoglycoside/choline kinase family phosphotransferase
MLNINQDIVLFLEKFGISSELFDFVPLQADASLRRYYRISRKSTISIPSNYDGTKIDFTKVNSLLLMHCPVSYQSIEPFIDIAEHLLQNSIIAPKIYFHDKEMGLMLLEDFGDKTLNLHINQNQNNSFEIYREITDLLVEIQNIKLPSFLSNYSDEILLNELNVFCKYYYLYTKNCEMDVEKKNDFLSIFSEVLSENNKKTQDLGLKKVIVLRDFHVDNLMYIKGYDELSSKYIGVLDFQDALLGNPIYDVVSLLDDARNYVDEELSSNIKEYYIKKTKTPLEYFFETYNIFALQRNLRILGVFARKFVLERNDSYLKMIPIMINYIERNVKNSDKNSNEKIRKIYNLVM